MKESEREKQNNTNKQKERKKPESGNPRYTPLLRKVKVKHTKNKEAILMMRKQYFYGGNLANKY